MPFWRVIRPTKSRKGLPGSIPYLVERRGGIGLSIFLEVDPVVDHMQAIGSHFEEPFHVRLGFAGDGDDGIRHFQRGLLEPDREVVSATELFAFPGPERFERMDRDDERNAVIYFRENPAEVAVPGVAVDEIGLDICRIKIRAAPDRTKDGTQRLRAVELRCIESESSYGKISVFQFLISKTPHLDRHRLREFA